MTTPSSHSGLSLGGRLRYQFAAPTFEYFLK